jgi:hypothetical protein
MEEADDGIVGELIDVAGLDLQEILSVDSAPLAHCISRLIAQNRRGGSAIAGFDAFIGGGEDPTNVA